jgi:hypothetical protein
MVSVASEREGRTRSPPLVTSSGPESTPVQTYSTMPAPSAETGQTGPPAYSVGQLNPAFVTSEASMNVKSRPIESAEDYHIPEATANTAGTSPAASATAPGSETMPQPHQPPALANSIDLRETDKHRGLHTGPVYTVLPVHVAATCPLDQILIGFFRSNRELCSGDTVPETVIGPQKASVKALINTDLSTSVHPLSKVMSEVMSTYPYVGKPEQMALFYLMHQTMRVGFCLSVS